MCLGNIVASIEQRKVGSVWEDGGEEEIGALEFLDRE